MMIRKMRYWEKEEKMGTQWGNDPKAIAQKRQGTCECTKHSGKISAEESRWGRSDRAYPLPVKRLFSSWRSSQRKQMFIFRMVKTGIKSTTRLLPDARNRRRRSRVGNGWWGFAGKKNDGQSDLLQRNRAVHHGEHQTDAPPKTVQEKVRIITRFMCLAKNCVRIWSRIAGALFDLCGGRRSKCFKNAQSDGGTFDGRDPGAINIGIGECMDLFSYFGAFSAAPTSNLAEKTAKILEDTPYTVDYFTISAERRMRSHMTARQQLQRIFLLYVIN